jgi:hypothetical protein
LDKGGSVRGLAIVPFREERHHLQPLYYTANPFWKHLARIFHKKGQTSSKPLIE